MTVLSGNWWQDESVQLASEEVEQVEMLTEVGNGYWSTADKSSLQTGFDCSEGQHMKGATTGYM